MGRLVAFGCSHTYGSGLPDCFIPNPVRSPKPGESFIERGICGPKPSQYAWPALLARHLNLDIQNLGSPGAGNNEILMRLMDTDLDVNDTVIILWSYFTRHDFYRYTYENIGERINPHGSAYRQLLNQMDPDTVGWKIDNAIKNYLTIEFAHMYLNQYNIKYYSLFSVPDFYVYDIPKFVDMDNVIRISLSDITIDKGLDNAHFGPNSHDLLANKIFDIINT